jgi:phage terminase large subunit-like protein
MTNCETSWLKTRWPIVRLMVHLFLQIREARVDVNTFIEFCFNEPSGKPIRQAAVHRDLQDFLATNSKALVELPRDHGKSTQVCARLAWELGRDPSLRVKIVCASEAIAGERGRFLREAIHKNSRVRLVFPNLAPQKPWTDMRFSVARPANVIGPSVTAIGIDGASTGTRADLLVCDDIVDVSAVTSRAERDRVKTCFNENLMNLLEPTGRFWGLCTPWHPDDANAQLKKTGGFALFRRAVDDDLTPVWPERWSREALATRRTEIGPVAFARGYRLVSLAADESIIQADWIKYWRDDSIPDQIVLAIDPALTTHARADRSAFVVLGKTDHTIRCLDAVACRVNTPDMIDMIGALDAHWNPTTIVFESNGAFQGIFEMMVRQSPFGAKLRAMTAHQSKQSRVQVLGCAVRNGLFLLKSDGVTGGQRELLDEMIAFPNGERDDLVDAAAMGTAFLTMQREPRVLLL